ncbi:MAG TPA: hypothetical protein VFV95_15170 [Vicinamibacterales bacterium]|nr:hypothetical protein [Vicinamibacterales bacterium]
MQPRSLLPEDQPIVFIDAASEDRHAHAGVVATSDHELIRRWAGRRHAEPATGEATESGPATVSVNDHGAGVRFNFPGVSRFRPIEWDEWFRNFDAHALAFVYERDEPGRTLSNRYRLVPMAMLREVARVV